MKNIPVPLKKNKIALLLIFAVVVISHPGFSQEKDSVKTPRNFKNTIRINITNPMIFGEKFNVIGYERVVNDYQTFSVGFGRFAFPKFSLVDRDSIRLDKDFKDKGFNMSFDYRFYLMKENLHKAPRGVYIGPFYSYNYFQRTNSWELNTSSFVGEATTKLEMNMHSIGFQLGYQFIFWKRVSLDLILVGPSMWFFNLKANLTTTLSPEDESLLFETINDALNNKFPGSDLVIDGGSFKKNGSFRTNTFGYRYMFNIGFRF